MKVLAIEFDSNYMNYVVVDGSKDNPVVQSSNRLVLSHTRLRTALVGFQDALKALFNSVSPDRIAIKDKPETGRMRAGAAALKMEGIALANARCDIDFVSGSRVNKVASSCPTLFAYLQPAYKCGIAALAKAEA